jgi:Fungal protein kinase
MLGMRSCYRIPGDVSTENFIMNEGKNNRWQSSLINFDPANKEQQDFWEHELRLARAAIVTLLGEKHLFMHDLESSFWVHFFWICIHYAEPDRKGRVANLKSGMPISSDLRKKNLER